MRIWLSVLHGCIACEHRYRQLFENAGDIVFTLDLDGKFTSMNKAGQRVTGYSREEILTMNVAGLLSPEDDDALRERIRQSLGGEMIPEFELPVKARDGRRVLLQTVVRLDFEGGMPVGIQAIARQSSEPLPLDMEGVGRFAGGVAHDFNNVLSAILGYADLLKENSHPGDLVREAAEVIEMAAGRGQELSARLMRLAVASRCAANGASSGPAELPAPSEDMPSLPGDSA